MHTTSNRVLTTCPPKTCLTTHPGIVIAIAIALHNLPEGVVIAMPIYYATGSKSKAFFWASISGLAEPIGGLIVSVDKVWRS